MRSHLLLITLCTLSLSGCSTVSGMFKQQPEAPKTGSLTQRFTMVDAEGKNYGVVELDPVNGGKITDVQGRLIGYVTPPAAAAQSAVPAPAPIAVQPVAPTEPLQPMPQAVPAYPYGR